jgi:hypothetical protein
MKKIDFLKKFTLAIVLITSFTFSNVFGQDSLQCSYDGSFPPTDLSGNGVDLGFYHSNNDVIEITGAEALAGGPSWSFPGTADGMLNKDGQSLNLSSEMTFVVFVKPTATKLQGILGLQYNFGLSQKDNGDGTFSYEYTIMQEGDAKTYCNADASFDPGVWHHVAGVYDGTNMLLYIDGDLAKEVALTGAIQGKSGRFAVGNDYANVGIKCDAKIDGFKVFNKALTAEQIKAEALVAYAGDDQNVGIGTTVTLDGSNSIGSITSYEWTLNSEVVGTTEEISTDTLSVGTHLFTLTVSDGTNSKSDDVTVNVANLAAIAGDDQTVDEGTVVTLDGSASVGDGLSYSWTLGGIEVSNIETLSTDTLSIGEYTFTLTVTNGDSETANDDVVVTVSAVSVVADAGKNQAVTMGYSVILDASGSTGFGLTYAWRLNETDIGSTAEISTDTLSLGKHTFALAITDAHGTTSADTVYIDVEGTESLVDFETMANDTAFLDLENGKKYLIFDTSNGPDKTNGDRLPETGAEPTLVSGVKGQAMEFDGSHDWINLQKAYTRGGFNAKSEDYSTSVWFKADITHRNPPKSPSLVIFDSPGFGLMLNGDILYATFYSRDRDDGDATRGAAMVTKDFTTTDEWINVTMVFDGGAADGGTSSLFMVYINGELYATETISNQTSFYADWYDWANIGATTGYASIASNVPESIHPYLQEGNMGGHFNGAIDELITTRTALTAQEVLDIYNDTDFATAIGDSKQTASIGVYPNPTKGDIRISGIEGAAEVEVLNLAGSVVKAAVISTNETINLSDLNNGIYIIRIKSEGTVYSSKVTVTK